MAEQHTLRVIARIHSDFPTKFGIPRQSGLVEALRAAVVFEPEYRNPDACRGLEGLFSPLAHLAVLPGGAGELVPHGEAAATWRQYPYGGVCYPLPLPSQPHWPVLRPAGADRAASPVGTGTLGSGG